MFVYSRHVHHAWPSLSPSSLSCASFQSLYHYSYVCHLAIVSPSAIFKSPSLGSEHRSTRGRQRASWWPNRRPRRACAAPSCKSTTSPSSSNYQTIMIGNRNSIISTITLIRITMKKREGEEEEEQHTKRAN